MNRLQELKLAIYEKEVVGKISSEDRDILLEAVEEKYYSIDEAEELSEESSVILDSYRIGQLTMEEAVDILVESGDDKAVKIVYIEDINDTIKEIVDQCASICNDFRKGNFIVPKAKLKIAIAKLKTLKKDISKCNLEAKKYNISIDKLCSKMELGTLVGGISGCLVGMVIDIKKKNNDGYVTGASSLIGVGVGASIPLIEKKCNEFKFNLSKKYKIFKSSKHIDKMRDDLYDYIDICIKALQFILSNIDNIKIEYKKDKLENKKDKLDNKIKDLEKRKNLTDIEDDLEDIFYYF